MWPQGGLSPPGDLSHVAQSHTVAKEQAESVTEGRGGTGTSGEPLPGSVSSPGSESHERTGLCFLAFTGTARKTQSCPVPGEAVWPAAWPPAAVSSSRRVGGGRAGWSSGRQGGGGGHSEMARQMCFLPATSPAVDLPRLPETAAAVVTAPHGRARDAISESLVHVPLETFLETLESPGGSGGDSNSTGAVGQPALLAPPSSAASLRLGLPHSLPEPQKL